MVSGVVSTGRKIATRTLFIVAIPLLILGLIDPLEGGLALIAALIVYVVGFLLCKQLPGKILWIPFALAAVIGTVVLLFAIFGNDRVDGEGQMPPLIIGLMLYRAAVVATVVGSVVTAIRSFKKPS